MTDNMAFLAHRHGLAHTDCWCAHCENAAKQRPVGWGEMTWIEAACDFMHLCPECGNKRCPRASWHGNACQSVSTGDEETEA